MWIGHRKQIRKLTFRALALRRSESRNFSLSASCGTEAYEKDALLWFVFNEKQTQYQELLNKIGLRSLTNQRLAKIVCMVYKAIHYDHAPKSIKSY